MLRGRTQPTIGPLETAVELDRRGAKERVSLPPVPQRLKHQTEMLLVVEVPEEAEAVELVVGVGVVQLLEELQLFQPGLLPVDRKQSRVAHQRTSNICRGGAVQTIDTRLDTKRLNPRGNVFSHKKKRRKRRHDSHELIVADDLDRHLLAGPGGVPGSDHVAEDPVAGVAVHVIALV